LVILFYLFLKGKLWLLLLMNIHIVEEWLEEKVFKIFKIFQINLKAKLICQQYEQRWRRKDSLSSYDSAAGNLILN